MEVQVLKIDKRCRELELEIIDDYDELAKAKSRYRGKLMDIWCIIHIFPHLYYLCLSLTYIRACMHT